MNYYTTTHKGIKCLLCRHYCNLAEGQVGICGVNKNKSGELVNLVYGKATALNIDPIEKKPLYHFLPGSSALSIGTIGCNMKCPFCQNWELSQSERIGKSKNTTAEQLIRLAMENQCRTIAYTYNEPTVFYPFAKDVALLAKQHDIKNIFVSNGMESREILEDMVGVIDGFNIDLKSFDTNYYKKILKGKLEGVLDTLRIIREHNFWLEVTTLVIPDENDSEKELSQIANFIVTELGEETPWHVSAFYPNYKMRYKNRTPSQSLQKAYEIGKQLGLKYIYKGNVAEKGITNCSGCNENLIIRNGYFLTRNIVRDGICPVCNTKISGVWK